MQAALVASHWMHDDTNDFNTGIDQRGNANKNWNPNHVEGGVGSGLAASYHFGPDEANQFLLSFDAAAFLQRLEAAGFSSTHWVFNQTPAAQLEAATRSEFTYHGNQLNSPWRWIERRALINFSKPVASSGAGQRGYLLSNEDGLPAVGEIGMATEFDSGDGGGFRSDLQYVALGWDNSLANLCALAFFHRIPGSDKPAEMFRRYRVASTDYLYKARNGYHSYSNGKPRGFQYEADLHDATGYWWHRDLWLVGSTDAFAPCSWV